MLMTLWKIVDKLSINQELMQKIIPQEVVIDSNQEIHNIDPHKESKESSQVSSNLKKWEELLFL